MNINYYRQPTLKDEQESWQDCQFTTSTDLSQFTAQSLVDLNSQPILRQHHSTYLTGKETCRAHHFAKLLATKILPTGKVLWIDTLHGPHVCSHIYQELASYASVKENLRFVCLDILGGLRDNDYAVNRNIETLINRLSPTLVVIDDIDHLMPFCGVNVANEFCRTVRDITNHTETAFLFIGYNHLGKKAGTTGNLGKYLFLNATHVFSLSTQREVTTVRLVRSYDLSRNPDDTEYHFTVGTDNLPHEADSHTTNKPIDSNTLQEIVRDAINPEQSVTPEEFHKQVTARQRQLRQQERTDDLITQALHLNLIKPVEDNKEGSDPEDRTSGTSQPRYTLNTSNIDSSINTSLTLPTPPRQPAPPSRDTTAITHEQL